MRLLSSIFAVFMCVMMSGCGGSMEEKIINKIDAPDKSFKLFITQTWQGVPYGVKGNIYISDWADSGKVFVDKYFTDFAEDLQDEPYLVWDDPSKGFKYESRMGSIALVQK